jgi:non-ribosomal peptide synthetase-like protein
LSSLLHAFFDRAVGRWPDAVALDIPPGTGRPARTTLTYAALDLAADDVRRRLPPPTAPDQLIAILLPRESPWLLAAQLGVLRAGAAFTCLDPAFPDGQVHALLDDAAPAAIVVEAAAAARVRGLGVPPDAVVVVADGTLPTRGGDSPDPAMASPAWLAPSSLAYVIYTSGTSGRPKGVLIEHAGIANLVQADLDEFGLGPGDRVAQGSSAAYDSSLEETWLALASGATLVVADDATVRLGPDLVAWLAGERITVFCPAPTLLRSTGCDDPERALPDLHLLYVGGEALPEDVAERWSRGRSLVNGYGPTETTVTVVRERVRPGEPIAIGRPIRGVSAWVLDAHGHEVPAGMAGELCLAGVALARGYRGLPALTAERFPDHPALGRIYRTGDRAVRDATGRLFSQGRLDAQVKLRGYRIELEAIEACLASCHGVAQAAAAVQGDAGAQRLVAFVVPTANGGPLDVAALGAALARQLPAYTVPARIGVLDALPTTVGGKLDRASLPVLDVSAAGSAHPHVDPRSPIEMAVASAVQAALRQPAPISVYDDFFTDLGGDSLGAGVLVSRLRERADTAALTTRDVYEARTVAALAARVRPNAPATTTVSARLRPLPSTARVVAASAVQTAWIVGELAITSLTAYIVVAVAAPWLDARIGLSGIVVLLPFAAAAARLLWTPAALLITAAIASVLVGRVAEARVPAWSSLHVRLWIVQRVAAHIPWEALAGTHALSVALRTLGAQVGHRVHVHRGVDLAQGCWHLLALGDDVSLARDVAVRIVDLDDGHIVVGPVSLGAGATLDIHAGVAPGSHIGAGASLGPWTSVSGGTRVPDGERWDGVPATRSGRTPPPPPIPGSPQKLGAWTHAAAFGAARTAAGAAFWIPVIASVLAVLAVTDVHTIADLRARLWSPALWMLAAAGSVAALSSGLALSAGLCRLLGAERPGVTATRSWTGIRVELKTRLLDGASAWLSGSVFWPRWLRAAGMRIGTRGEVSSIIDTVPDLVTIGDECFLADGVYLAAPFIDRGSLTLAPVRIGARTFVGNHVVLGPGAVLPDDALVGVCTVVTAAMAEAPGAAWFGHPPLPLPRPRAVVDRRRTHEPSLVRRLNRGLWEAARLALPLGPLLVAAWWLEGMITIPAGGLGLVVSAAATTATAAAALAALCVALKWVLLGRVRPGEHPLWSCWCSRWDFMYVAWSLYVPWFVAPLEGTLWLPWYLRAMGMAVGCRVLLGPGFAQVVDPDMITIGDGATVHAMFQAHTFEDRVLKMGRVEIGAGATVGPGAVPLYATTVGAGTRVAPHSVIMKGETLAPHSSYEGAPVALVATR